MVYFRGIISFWLSFLFFPDPPQKEGEAKSHHDQGHIPQGDGGQRQAARRRQHIGDHGEEHAEDDGEGGGVEALEKAGHEEGHHHGAHGKADDHGQENGKIQLRQRRHIQLIQAQ